MRDFLAARPCALLAADMGTGKTPTSTLAADMAFAGRMLVVCPAIAAVNWCREIVRWSPERDPLYLQDRVADALAASEDTCVVSYDRMSRAETHKMLMRREWDVLILDEAHYLKGFSKRTRAVYGARYDGKGGLVSRAKQIWLLTGTPMPNHPAELWTHLHALHPDFATESYGRFVEQYCTVKQVPFSPRPVITGGKNLDHLRRRVGDWLMRVRKEDVLADLPPLRVDTLVVDGAEAEAALRDFDRSPEGERLRAVLRGDDSMDMECYATLRRLTGTAKADAVVAWVRDQMDAGLDKIVVFAHHRDVIARIRDGLESYGAVVVSGETSPTARQRAIDSFQQDAGVRVFVGQLQSASTAISLTAASDIVFAEADWTPAVNAQAISRCHRHGQHAPVTARFITLADSIDEAVMRAVARKTATISEMGLA